MKSLRILLTLLWVIFTAFAVMAQDDEEEEPVIPYFQTVAFNVPILESWENQSTEDIAQFYHADTQATIRTNVVSVGDTVDGAKQDLEAFLEITLDEPVYSEKVNLADGTWAVLVYQVDDDTTASTMARQHDGQTYVVSFIESNPDAEIIMATIERTDESLEDDSSLEITTILETFTNETTTATATETVELPSGEWQLHNHDDATAMGLVFGNDSYIALALGDSDYQALPELANAYNSTLLGFFITPNNANYLALGLTVVFVTLGILAFSIFWRSHNLQKDLAIIEQLAADE